MEDNCLSSEGESKPLRRFSRTFFPLLLLKPSIRYKHKYEHIFNTLIYSLELHNELSRHFERSVVIDLDNCQPQLLVLIIVNRCYLQIVARQAPTLLKHVIDLHSAIKARLLTKGTRRIIESWPHWHFSSTWNAFETKARVIQSQFLRAFHFLCVFPLQNLSIQSQMHHRFTDATQENKGGYWFLFVLANSDFFLDQQAA